jgi:hypothetical protein
LKRLLLLVLGSSARGPSSSSGSWLGRSSFPRVSKSSCFRMNVVSGGSSRSASLLPRSCASSWAAWRLSKAGRLHRYGPRARPIGRRTGARLGARSGFSPATAGARVDRGISSRGPARGRPARAVTARLRRARRTHTDIGTRVDLRITPLASWIRPRNDTQIGKTRVQSV